MAEGHRAIILGVLAAAVALGLGVIIGYFSRESSATVSMPQADPDASKMIMDGISTINIENNLRILTENPHIAGRDVDEKDLVNFVSKSFSDAGLEVEIHPYDVLLSYPDQEDSNYLAVQLANGTIIDKSHPTEEILDESQNKPGVVNPFNAYSSNGDPDGDLVYVNYGTIQNFIEISKTINLTNKICMARYGAIYRGDKVDDPCPKYVRLHPHVTGRTGTGKLIALAYAVHAEQYKCAGLIIYSDPKDFTLKNQGVYPESWFLPGTGAQRGSLFKGEGDPLTLHYPSIDTAWRLKEEDAPLPGIPVTPIGYSDAIMYLEKMAGDEVPLEWRGGLNITYRYGPGFKGGHTDSKMKMHVTTQNQRAIVHNVIGYIRGHVEPDRYVITGNHRDAWVFGAIDPSSGTAAMLEVARSFGEAVKNGWKPRRTIVFCSWGAEEYGLIGSTEWVEEFQKVLGSRSVAYINTDAIVQGLYRLNPAGSSSLINVVYEASKLVPNPNPAEVSAGRTTTYDTWSHVLGGGEPGMPTLGAGSDFTTFLQLTGIACVNVRHIDDPALGLASYPVYHSVYETFDLVKKFLDPEFKYHQAVGRVSAEIVRNLADSPLLPFNIDLYCKKITEDAETMLNQYGVTLRNNGVDTDLLNAALTNFSNVAKSFHKKLDQLDMADALSLRAANDQLMKLERAFIDKVGIEGRDQFSHVIYAPSLHNTYGGAAFPGLVDSMFEIDTAVDKEARWDEVRRQFSILLYHIGSAASTLQDVVPIKGYSNK